MRVKKKRRMQNNHCRHLQEGDISDINYIPIPQPMLRLKIEIFSIVVIIILLLLSWRKQRWEWNKFFNWFCLNFESLRIVWLQRWKMWHSVTGLDRYGFTLPLRIPPSQTHSLQLYFLISILSFGVELVIQKRPKQIKFIDQ